MIIARTPFRMSFCGGGSDLRDFYKKDYGAVVSSSINKYMYIIIHDYFHDKIRIKYSKVEDVDRAEDIKHPLVRECLKKVDIDKGIEIASIADAPAGTGLGSSSSFTVCLLHALYTYKQVPVSKEKLASEACEIEIDILKEPIGKQDQYAASFGGLNFIRFNKDESVHFNHLMITKDVKKKLEENLLMFYFGNERNASEILSEQKSGIKEKSKYDTIKKMVKLAEDFRSFLLKGEIDKIGELLNLGWQLKKELAPNITNLSIDEYYKRGLKAGATGGKILGAGGGGFFLFFCPPQFQDNLRKELKLREMKFNFENDGSKIIYTDG